MSFKTDVDEIFMGDTDWRPEVLVLGSGGMKGYLILGCLMNLEKNDYLKDVTKWVGCSIGAFISLLKIVGYGSMEIANNSSDLTIFAVDQSEISISKIKERHGLTGNEHIRARLEKLVKDKVGIIPTLSELYENTGLELIVVATKLGPETVRTVFRKDTHPDVSCIDAVLASSNIPYIFERVKIGGHEYIDGALVDPYPISIFDDGLTKILGIYIYVDYGDVFKNILCYTCAITSTSMDELRRRSVKQSSRMCKHLRLKMPDIPFMGILLDEKARGLMIKNGFEQCKQYILLNMNNIKIFKPGIDVEEVNFDSE